MGVKFANHHLRIYLIQNARENSLTFHIEEWLKKEILEVDRVVQLVERMGESAKFHEFIHHKGIT